MLSNWPQHVEVTASLTDAGVVDTGTALTAAIGGGCEASVKFPLQHREWSTDAEHATYLDTCSRHDGHIPLVRAIFCARFASSRIVRLLVDAGANATANVPFVLGSTPFDLPPLGYAIVVLDEKRKNEDKMVQMARKTAWRLSVVCC